ncbi:MAG TPA: hypothetical protein VIP11_20560 [Gemmatimonadaceae bacterium]
MRMWPMLKSAQRASRAVCSATLLATLPACYEYRAVETTSAPVGERVALQISDRGRIGLAERFGPGVTEIRGTLVSQAPSELVVSVSRVSQLDGSRAMWSGESTRLDRSYVGLLKQRQLSPTRTIIMSVAAAGIAYLAVSGDLTGQFSRDSDDPLVPEPPLRTRRPVRIPFGFRF